MANDRNEYSVQKRNFNVKLDSNILFTLLGISALSLIILGVKMATYQKCEVIQIKVSSPNILPNSQPFHFLTNESIHFEALSKNGKEYVWDFGDGTPSLKTQRTTHHYLKSGIYQVKILVNGKCREYQEITIHNSSVQNDELKNALNNNKPYIDGPINCEAGQQVTFIDPTPKSMSWKWTVLGENQTPLSTQSATFIFNLPGEKIIKLETNGDVNRNAEKKIIVTASKSNMPAIPSASNMPPPSMPARPMPLPAQSPAPTFSKSSAEVAFSTPEPVVEKKIIKYYDDERYKEILQDIANGDAEPDKELLPKLCLSKDTKLYLNGSVFSWLNFMTQLKGKEINTLTVVRNFENKNCVQALKVSTN